MNRTLLFSAALFFGSALFAETAPPKSNPSIAQGVDVQFDQKQSEVDMDALRRWLQDKRLISLDEVGGDLSISGEVRTECQFINEKSKAQGAGNFIKQRGINSATGKANLAWDVEFNLMIDYRTDRTWAAMKVEFDNDMGVVSGTVNRVRLEKAYLGGRLIAGDTFTWDAEIGRRYLINVYDSRVQFGSVFDGGLFRFGKAFDEIGDFYANVSAFLVDERFDHYGEAVEIGALRIANLPLNMRYSVINWYRHFSQAQLATYYSPSPAPVAGYPQPWNYLVNQYIVFYQDYPQWMGKKLLKIYLAGLINPLAQEVFLTGNTKQNLGWYAGVSIGVVKKAGDWAFDTNFQWVQAQLVPNQDCTGIGRGNAAGTGFYTVKNDGTGGLQTQAGAVGTGNYKGIDVDALYAFTDNLTVQQHFAMSWTLNKNIGPDLDFKQYEVEFIYAF